MADNSGKIFLGVAALAVLWIVVYWVWEPGRPAVSFADPVDADEFGMVQGPFTIAPTGSEPPIPGTRIAPVAGSWAEDDTASQRVAVIPPRFRDYTVKERDTFASIARRELGSAKWVGALREANPLIDPERIRAGRVIKIPLDPTNIQGRPVPVQEQPAVITAGTPGAGGGSTGRPPVPPAPRAAATEYTVRPGDTLSEIAKRHYGSTAFKDLIYEANRDQLDSPDAIRQGQKLRLPPKP